MEINLKRALKLRRVLEAQTKTFALPSVLKLSVLSDLAKDPARAVGEAREEMIRVADEAIVLSQILSKLRSDILRANVENGVEDHIAQIAQIDRLISIEKTVADVTGFTPDLTTLTQEVEIAVTAAKTPVEAASRIYGRAPREIDVALVTQDMRDRARIRIAELRRQREDVDDARTAANARIRIEIGDDHAKVLRDLGLI